jgi:hypothetical protein
MPVGPAPTVVVSVAGRWWARTFVRASLVPRHQLRKGTPRPPDRLLARSRPAQLEAGVGAWLLLGVGASGWSDFRDAVVAELDGPTVVVRVVAGFEDAVVVGAEQDEVPQGGGSAGPPRDDVVGVATLRRNVAAGEHAAAVA